MTIDHRLRAYTTFGVIYDETTSPGIPHWSMDTVGDGAVSGTITYLPSDADLSVVRPFYRLYSASSPGAWTAGVDVTTPTVGEAVPITGLTNDLQYEFTIACVDVNGNVGDFGNIYRRMPTSGSTDPAGMMSKPLEYLRKTIAASGTFQAWVGAEDEEAALASIYAVLTTTFTKPFCVVEWNENFQRSKNSSGTRNHFVSNNELLMYFVNSISSSDSEYTAAKKFTNTVGAILDDMEQIAGTPGYLNIEEIALVQGPERPRSDEKETVGDYWQIIFKVRYS